jgi:hypothetical protein
MLERSALPLAQDGVGYEVVQVFAGLAIGDVLVDLAGDDITVTADVFVTMAVAVTIRLAPRRPRAVRAASVDSTVHRRWPT